MTEMTDTATEQQQMRGTPITRSGGYMIRVGWGAVGYSVDRDTEARYRRLKGFLLALAIAVGVGVAVGVEYLLFGPIAPLAGKVTSTVKHYPEVWKLAIYGFTFMFGWLIYRHIVAGVGLSMVKRQSPLDKGYSLFEQRQRAAKSRKRELFILAVGLGVLGFAPIGLSMGLKVFLLGVVGLFFLEGLYFKLVKPLEAK